MEKRTIKQLSVKLENGTFFPLEKLKIAVDGSTDRKILRLCDGSIALFQNGRPAGSIPAGFFPKSEDYLKVTFGLMTKEKYELGLKKPLHKDLLAVMVE